MANKYRFDFGCDGWKDCVLASDYDTMVADRDQISLTLAVAKADRDKWFGRARALEAALRKLGYATVEYVGKRGDGNAFADLVQAEHDARALLPSQVPGVNKDVARTLRKDQEMPMVKRWECDCEADDNVPTDAAYVGAVLGADYDALAAELAEVKCRHNLFVMDMCKVVPERNELKARVAALEAALREAKESIKVFHDMGSPKHMREEMWTLYQQSPEMKRLNAALTPQETKGEE